MNQKGLKPIAMFEASKGFLSLIVAFGIHAISNDNIQQGAEKIISHLHLNPASHYPSILIHSAGELNNSSLVYVALGALLYSVIRFIEAYGLWHSLRWTEWFALISGAVYLPFEAYEFIKNTNFLSTAFLFINSVIVIYLYYVLNKQHKISNKKN